MGVGKLFYLWATRVLIYDRGWSRKSVFNSVEKKKASMGFVENML